MLKLQRRHHNRHVSCNACPESILPCPATDRGKAMCKCFGSIPRIFAALSAGKGTIKYRTLIIINRDDFKIALIPWALTNTRKYRGGAKARSASPLFARLRAFRLLRVPIPGRAKGAPFAQWPRRIRDFYDTVDRIQIKGDFFYERRPAPVNHPAAVREAHASLRQTIF